jgi:ubiquinone biosynthesis protein
MPVKRLAVPHYGWLDYDGSVDPEISMKISSLPHIYRNVNRLTEIMSVLSKYGLADGISRLNLDFAKGLLRNRDGEALARHTRETRIRMALTELGPTFIKLGQILSTRPDLVGRRLADELSLLQDQVPADPPEKVRELIESELGQPISDLFQCFDDQPVASGSIGQVHRACLRTGEPVVIKVQHARIQEVVRKDLEVLSGLAQLVSRLPEFVPYRPVETVAEFQRTLRRELDFGREERNLQHFCTRFEHNTHVRIPRPVSELCTPRVLTMEDIEGVKLSEVEKLAELGINRDETVRRGADLYLDMIFLDGFFHADPHPGNILILPNGQIGLLDFGMVGRIDEHLRELIEDMLLAIINGDAELLSSIILRIGSPPPDLDESVLRTELADFVAHYATRPLDRLVLSDALDEMTDMIFRYRIMLPAQAALLLKVLIILEGSSRLLCPSFTLMQVIRPFQRRALLRRLSPARRLKKLRRMYTEVEHLVEVLPRRLYDILEQIQLGKFDVHLDHRGLEPSVNRLALALLASALFLGSSLLLTQKVPPLLFRTRSILGMHELSLLGLAGCIVSLLLGLRLLRAIGKSGHLDRRK